MSQPGAPYQLPALPMSQPVAPYQPPTPQSQPVVPPQQAPPQTSQPSILYQQAMWPPRPAGRGLLAPPSTRTTAPVTGQTAQECGRPPTRGRGVRGRSASHPRRGRGVTAGTPASSTQGSAQPQPARRYRTGRYNQDEGHQHPECICTKITTQDEIELIVNYVLASCNNSKQRPVLRYYCPNALQLVCKKMKVVLLGVPKVVSWLGLMSAF